MTRDEILAAIRQASEFAAQDGDVEVVAPALRSVVALADEYMELDDADRQYLAESLRDAMENFADALQRYA